MDFGTSLALVGILAISLYAWFRLAFRERLALSEKIPGPTSYPLVGHLYLIRSDIASKQATPNRAAGAEAGASGHTLACPAPLFEFRGAVETQCPAEAGRSSGLAKCMRSTRSTCMCVFFFRQAYSRIR